MGNFNTPLYPVDRSLEPQNRETSYLHGVLHQRDLPYNYKIFYPNSKEYSLYITAHGSFYKTYETNFDKYRKIIHGLQYIIILYACMYTV